jgi:tRNA U34 5-methylaminomethyl-2-thiouridine-forming methyltransferase MnmC
MDIGEMCATFSAFAEMGIFRRQAANARAEGEMKGLGERRSCGALRRVRGTL